MDINSRLVWDGLIKGCWIVYFEYYIHLFNYTIYIDIVIINSIIIYNITQRYKHGQINRITIAYTTITH